MWEGAWELVVVVDGVSWGVNLTFSFNPLFDSVVKNKRGVEEEFMSLFDVGFLSKKLYDKSWFTVVIYLNFIIA